MGDTLHQALRQARRVLHLLAELLERPPHRGDRGSDRAIGSVASHIEVALWEPGHVLRGGAVGRDHGHTVFRVGEHDGRMTPRIEKIAGMLDRIDAAYASDNLWGERWAKLCQNSMGNAISAMTALGSQDMAQDPRCRLIRIQLAKEGAHWPKA